MLKLKLRWNRYRCRGCFRECEVVFYDNLPNPLYCPFLMKRARWERYD